jgi:hypothetical protein
MRVRVPNSRKKGNTPLQAGGPALLKRDVFGFPLAAGFDLPFAPVRQFIGVRPVIVLALRDKGLVDKRV